MCESPHLRDSDEKGLLDPTVGDAGQQVSALASSADYYVVTSGNRETLGENASRIFSLVLGHGTHQPTQHERRMHLAFSAGNSSYCLSRQVGAALFDHTGNVLGVGCNDVPKPGGGLWRSEDKHDSRCYQLGDRRCINDTNKQERFERLADKICKEVFGGDQTQRSALLGSIKTSEFGQVTEFCRGVHAEMEAILSSARNAHGSTIGASLYVTTQPCHNCVKHIICSGIASVYYIEPYPKSMAEELHSDAVLFGSATDSADGKVQFVPYEGISPHKFHDFFSMARQRKNDEGKMIVYTREEAALSPRVSASIVPRRRPKDPDLDPIRETVSFKEFGVAKEISERYGAASNGSGGT